MEKKQSLHPSVEQFKSFIQQHPSLMKEVSEKRKTLQELFEEWSVLGPDHKRWEAYRKPQATSDHETNNSETSSDTIGQLFATLKRMNVQDLQAYIVQFSSVLATVQQLIQSFQRPDQQQSHQSQSDPFSFRRD